MNRVAPARLLIIVFLTMLLLPPVLQAVVEASRRELPRALQILTQRPTPQNLRASEKELQDTSLTARALRPWMQTAQFFALHDAGEKAIVGRDGWLFYQPGVAFLTQRARPHDSNWREALSAVVRFHETLAARGVRLVVMPAPNKESVYPDKLASFAVPPKAILSEETRLFLKECQAAGVEVVDLFALYRKAREASSPPLYLTQDSHWSPDGVALAVASVAERLCLKPQTSFGGRPVSVHRIGDLIQMLRSPVLEKHVTPESIVCTQVVRGDTNQTYRDEASSDVLILGDSFLRIYEQDAPGSAGFVAQLARATGRPLTSIVNDGGASTLVRQQLFRHPELLALKKIVVWEFVERDLRLGTEGWQIIPLPPETESTKDRTGD